MDVIIEGLNNLEKFNVDVHSVDKRGKSLLHYAAEVNAEEGIKHLIKKGANINLVSHDRFTPTMVAASSNSVRAIELLAAAGADPYHPRGKVSALHVAVFHNNIQSVYKLLSLGSDPNCLDKCGLSPIQLALKMGHLKCFQILMSHGGRFNM